MPKEINKDKPEKPKIVEVFDSLMEMISEDLERILQPNKEVDFEVKKEKPEDPTKFS